MLKRWGVVALVCGCSIENPGFVLDSTRGGPESSGAASETTPAETTDAPTSTASATNPGETTMAIEPTGAEATGPAGTEETGGPGETGTTTTDEGSSEGSSEGGDPLCLNGVLDGEEACDDGNKVPADGCEANCRFMFRAVSLQLAAPSHVAAADLDGDGQVELIVAQDDLSPAKPDVTVLVHAGGDAFEALSFDDEVYANVGQVVVGQFAGDPLPDLVVINPDGPGVRLWTNVSGMAIGFEQVQLGNLASVQVHAAERLRLDATPLDDLVLASPGKDFLFVVKNDGDLDAVPFTVPAELAGPTALAVGTFQPGDPFDDVIAVHPGLFDDVSEYRGVGNGALMKNEATLAACAADPGGVAAGDADGLGARDDSVIACSDGSVAVYASDGNVRSVTTIGAGLLGIPASAGFIDLYEDGGESDLFVLSEAPKDLRIVVRRAGQEFVTAPIALASFGRAAVAADVDDDGALDLAVAEPTAGVVQVFFNQTQLPSP